MGESDSTETKVALPIPVGGSIGGLQVRTNTAPGGSGSSNSYSYTVYVNGAATAVVCSIFEVERSCNDSTHSVTVNPGDRVALRQQAFSGPSSVTVTWSFYIGQ
jgi:hypothetical protein